MWIFQFSHINADFSEQVNNAYGTFLKDYSNFHAPAFSKSQKVWKRKI